MSRRSSGVACILAALALAASCGGGADDGAESSGVEGVALIGPTCPVESDPPDPDCDDRPRGGIAPFSVPVATTRVVSNRFTRVELRVDSGIR